MSEWVVDKNRKEAMNEHGYRITWARLHGKLWLNAWSPFGTHIGAGFDRDILTALCTVHHERIQAQREERKHA